MASQDIARVAVTEWEQGIAGAEVKELTGLQKAGLSLAMGVGLVAFVLILGIGYVLVRNLPPRLPALPVSASPQDIERYKELAQLHQQMTQSAIDQSTKLFQLVVITALLPIFTTILGYIFGSRKAE